MRIVQNVIISVIIAILLPACARLELRSEPSGADVRVSNRHVGQTPIALRVRGFLYVPRSLQLTVEKPGYEPRTVVVGPDSPDPYVIRLTPATRIQSTPSGARVQINGQYVGVTPTDYVWRSESSASLEVELSDFEKHQATIGPATRSPYSIELKRLLSSYVIDSKPQGAKVVLGGQRVGTTPMKLSIPPSEQSIVIETDGYRSYSGTISWKSPNPFVIDLETAAP